MGTARRIVRAMGVGMMLVVRMQVVVLQRLVPMPVGVLFSPKQHDPGR
jgi:hypothetical protein